MIKIRKLVAVALGLLLGMHAFSYKMYAEDNLASMADNAVWDIQNALDIPDCKQGETVTLSVHLKGGGVSKEQDILEMSGILEYDNSLFIVEKADILPVENSKVQAWSFDASSGMFRVAYESAVTVQDGDLLLQIQLHVAANASTGKTTVCITNMEWHGTDNGQMVEVEHRIPAQLTIAKADINAVVGDVNLDGRINLIDAKLVMQHYNGVKSLDGQQKKGADTNGDGEINLLDAKLIMKYYNGEINEFSLS